jgi:hypothetical protein
MRRALFAVAAVAAFALTPVLWTSCGGPESEDSDASVIPLDAGEGIRVLLQEDFSGKTLNPAWQFEEISAANHVLKDDKLELWTPVSAPPYYATTTTRAHRAFDVPALAGRTVKLIATFKGDATDLKLKPVMTIGLAGDEQSLFKLFGNDTGLFCSFGGQTHAVDTGIWYKLTLTVSASQAYASLALANGGAIFETADVAVPVEKLKSFQFDVTITDTHGQASIVVDDVHVEQAP